MWVTERQRAISGRVWTADEGADYERQVFLSEVQNRLSNARAQLELGQERLEVGEPSAALLDLEEADRILDDLPLLAEDYTSYTPVEDNERHLEEQRPRIVELRREGALLRGRAHLDLGEFVEAETAFEGVLRAEPSNAEALVGRGRARTARGELGLALADLDQAIGLVPSSPSPYLARGELRAAEWKQGQDPTLLEAALADFDQALARDPGHPQAFLRRAALRLTLAGANELEARERWCAEAETDLVRARKLDPLSAMALLQEARLVALRAEGRSPSEREPARERALELLRQARERGLSLEPQRGDRAFQGLRDLPEFQRLTSSRGRRQ
jgi:tetratricopeptide (TPR) repeat protein